MLTVENVLKKERKKITPSPTSFRCLKLLRGAGGTLSLAVVNPDIERVETEGVQTRQHAVAVVPTKFQDLLFRMMGVVFVEVVLPPVVHLQDTVRVPSVLREG